MLVANCLLRSIHGLELVMGQLQANRWKLSPAKTELRLVGAPPDWGGGAHPVWDGVTLPLQVHLFSVLVEPALRPEAPKTSVTVGGRLLSSFRWIGVGWSLL